jgi:Tfp pilus assembly protein PilN
MSNINLLPWREAAKLRQKNQFFAMLIAGAVVSAILVVVVNFVYQHAISRQNARNQFLQAEMAQLDIKIGEINRLKIRRAELIERMRLIDQLQQSRNLAVHIFDQLPSLVTTGVYLDSLSYKERRIDVVGKSEAHSRVANMMRLIDKSGWLGQTTISSIYASDSKPISLSQFAMMFNVLKESERQSGAKAPSSQGGQQ